MFKLDLEKAGEPEIKLSISIGSSKKQESSRKTSALLTTPKPLLRASLVAQTVTHLSAMQETGVQSLGWEDPLEKEMAAYSSILAWKIPWTSEPGRLPSKGLQRNGRD